MKKRRSVLAAVTSLAAAAVLAVPSGAYITEVSDPADTLISDDSQWTITLSPEINASAENISGIDLVLTLSGDADKYASERSNGYYDDGEQTAFTDFAGFIGIGAEFGGTATNNNWFQFDYNSLNEKEGSEGKAAVISLGDNRYLLSCDFGGVEVHAPDRDVTFSFKDWGNKSPNYSMTVDEMYVYGPDGTVAIYADANGALEFEGHERFSAGTEGDEAPEETTSEAPQTSAPEETTAAEVTEADASDNAAETSAQTEPSQSVTSSVVTSSSGQGFGSRDSTLMIVGIVAGVIILAVIVVLIMMVIKKKK